MRAIVLGLLLMLLPCAANGVLSQDAAKPSEGVSQGKPAIEPNVGLFEKRWNMKLVAISPPVLVPAPKDDPDAKALARMAYVLEFQEDVINFDLDELQRLFYSDPSQTIRHVFLDADNIAIDANLRYKFGVQGQVSGVKGEAIRVVFEFGSGQEQDARLTIQQARKLVVRRPR